MHSVNYVRYLYYKVNNYGVVFFYGRYQGFTKSFGSVSLKIAKNMLTKWINNYELEQYQSANYIMIDELFSDYMKTISKIQSKHELKNKLSRYKNYIYPTFGDLSLYDIKYKDCQIWVNDLLDRNLSPKTVENIKNLFSAFFTYCIKNEYIEKSPFKYVELPKYDNKVVFSLTKDEIKRLVDAIVNFEDTMWRGFFIVLLHGRRLGEVINLTWDCVRLEDRIYTIPYKNNKVRKNQYFAITDLMYYILKDRLVTKTCDNDLVFKSNFTGNKIVDVRNAWHKILDKAGIKYMRIHDFRHLLASVSINDLNIPIEKVSFALGHLNITTTQRYISQNVDNSKFVVDKFLEAYL